MIGRHARLALFATTALLSPATAWAQAVAIPAGPPERGVEQQQADPATPGQASAVSTESADTASATSEGGSDIVVTGSRITANGYKAPTPVTIVSSTELLKKAPESLAAGLTRLPQFAPTSGTNVRNSQAGTPSAGNYLDLRRLGAIETLVLLDGYRLPPTSFNGTVDANTIPQSLIQRVDVVTGGASAAYGSDAVSGVVNFVLDKQFTGFKASVQGGVSTRGDDHQLKIGLAAGAPFADGRGHAIASFDYFYQPGIKDNGRRPRGANLEGGCVETGTGTAANPYTPICNVRFGNATYGTLINAGTFNTRFSLRNFQFLDNGSIAPFNAGTPTGTANFVVGGDGGVSFGTSLTAKLRTKQAFGRLEYEVADGIKAFAQAIYSDADTSYVTVAAGTQLNAFQIFADNAFLPTIVSDTMRREGVTSFVASRIEADQTPKRVVTNNEAASVFAGLEGNLGQLKWSTVYSRGSSVLQTAQAGNFDQSRFFAALDAVRGPQGNIVCRITLTNPGLQDGCLPWNPFGNGAPSAASYAYIDQVSRFRIKNIQDDVSAQLSGSLFNLPAGPINFAVGAEYRHQSLNQTSNTDPSSPISLVGLRTFTSTFNLQYNTTNVGFARGSQDIVEGFGELAVPILRDTPFFYSLDLNGAARYTDYSVSGGIWAWKGGFTWNPLEELRFRGTYSQDIRAPTLYELFAGTSATRGAFSDVRTGGNTNILRFSQGNPDLRPEKARTLALGAVWQPKYIPGFSASLDYYRIKINQQIATLNERDVNQQCETSNGTDPICRFISRPLPFSDRSLANFPTSITLVPFNQASLKTYGFDYEVNYRLPMGNAFGAESARLDLRLIGNYTPKLTSFGGPGSVPVENAGVAAFVPKHKINLSADVIADAASFGIELRYLGATKYTNVESVIYTNNRISPVAYVNLNASYDIDVAGQSVTLFGSIANLLDRFVYAPQTGQPTSSYPTFQQQYDVVGRYFVGGARIKF